MELNEIAAKAQIQEDKLLDTAFLQTLAAARPDDPYVALLLDRAERIAWAEARWKRYLTDGNVNKLREKAEQLFAIQPVVFEAEATSANDALRNALSKISTAELCPQSVKIQPVRKRMFSRSYHCIIYCEPYYSSAIADVCLRLTGQWNSLCEWIVRGAKYGNGEAQYLLGLMYGRGIEVAENSQKAFHWYLLAANQGHCAAQVNVALAYENGRCTPKDIDKSIDWYKKAAVQGDDFACYKIGAKHLNANNMKIAIQAAEHGSIVGPFLVARAYDTGTGIDQNYAKAAFWYRKASQNHCSQSRTHTYDHDHIFIFSNLLEKTLNVLPNFYFQAAEQGDTDAMRWIAFAYEFGYGVKKNKASAMTWYEKAASLGNKYAQYSLGQQYGDFFGYDVNYDERDELVDTEQAFYWYLKAAKQAHAGAQYNVGWAYEEGIGVSLDMAQAAAWYRKAAEQGHEDAQYKLAQFYRKGTAVKKNLETAVQWYLKSAKQGIVEAQIWVAWAYDNGEGIQQDKYKAAIWYEKAAEQGSRVAQYNLGQYYRNGIGIKKDLEAAFKYFLQSAEQDDCDAQFRVAWAYDKGEGIGVDQIKAIKWYEKAANEGHQLAQYHLGMKYYTYYTEIPEDNSARIAFPWFQDSAKQGYAPAQFMAAQAYRNGEGCTKNDSKAYQWYLNAARQGYPDAINAIKAFYGDDLLPEIRDIDSIDTIQKRATQGVPEAQYRLGKAYFTGSCIEADNYWAFNWYRRAASNGFTKALYYLGAWYQDRSPYVRVNEVRGEYGWEPDNEYDEIAFEYFQQAANQGHCEAQIEIAKAFWHGHGVLKDVVQSAFWIKKAAEQGSKFAQLALGQCYRNGIGLQRDLETAFIWYLRAAEQGDREAQFRVAWAYDKGEGVALDSEKAMAWYKEASKQSHEVAQYNLWIAYLNGIGTKKDKAEAFSQLLPAAHSGLPDAEYHLGLCYEYGEIVEQDAVCAYHWFKKASKGGNQNARLQQKFLQNQLLSVELEKAKRALRDLAQNKPTQLPEMSVILADNIEVGKADENASIDRAVIRTKEDLEKAIAKEAVSTIDDVLHYTWDLDSWCKYRIDWGSPEKTSLYTALDLYDKAIEAEQKGDMLEAVVWYVWAAQRGSKKALYTLLNMGATGSLYFFDQPIAAIAKQLTEKDTF